MKVLVTGATGFVGREVLRQIHTAGHDVRVLARDARVATESLPKLEGAVEIHEGNVTQLRSLAEAPKECDAVIHLVGIISEAGAATFENLHVNATRNIVAATQAAGVQRYVHMSALGTRPNAVARYHRTKWEAEEMVRHSRLDFTIFRPSVIYGPEDHFVNLFARMSKWSPVLPLIGNGLSLLQPVEVENVARCFVGALTKPLSIGQTYDVCGPERLTMVDLLDAILKATGRRRVKVRVPLPMVRIQAMLLEKCLGGILCRPPPLNRDQLLMLQEDNVGDPKLAEQMFGLNQVRFADGILRYLRCAR